MASISPIVSEAGPSLEEILSRHGLKPTDLDKECPERVRDEVAVKLDDWEVTGRYLEFTLEKLRDINRENSSQNLCRIALLDTWGKREGKKATYLKLASVLHRRKRCDLVEFVCAKFKSTLSLVPLSGSITNWEISSGSHQAQQHYGGSSSPVPMIISQPLQEQIVTPDMWARYTCKISGVPAPTIKWTFNGKEISESGNIHIENNTTTLRNVITVTSTLHYRSLQESGQVACIGYHMAGEKLVRVTSEAHLIVHCQTNLRNFFEVMALNAFMEELIEAMSEYSTLNHALLNEEVVTRDAVYPLLQYESIALSPEQRSFLVKTIVSAVKTKSAKFQSLIKVLKNDILLEEIANEMESTFQKLQELFSKEVSDSMLLKLSEIESKLLPKVISLSKSDLQDVRSLGYGPKYTRFEILLKWKKSSKVLTLETTFLTLMKLNKYRCELGTGEVMYEWLMEAKGNTPTLRELQLLKLPSGTELQIMEEIASEWDEVAVALGFDGVRIKTIKMGAHYQPKKACRDMFTEWLKGDRDLQPPTWNVLIQSLTAAKLTEIADLLSRSIDVGAEDASDSTSTTMVIDTESQVKSSITGSDIEAKVADGYMKCPVCLNVLVDPCTLPCGHTFCQLCLARMWKSNQKICPTCKETWEVFPAISYDYRSNIESAHSPEVEQLRKEYSLEDKELIEEAKRIFNLKSESPAQKVEEKGQLPDVWQLPGVKECGETSVVVHPSQGQLVEWNGLKLHIHAGSLPKGLQQCTIFIKASLAGKYEIPKNTSLVSAFFWLRCEPQCTFTKPIVVEIQHCSTKQDLSKLKIVRAFCSQKPLPYKFKPLERGRFDANTSYGGIEVTHFSGYGVTENNPDSKLYYNQLFYCSDHHQQRHDIHIIYTLNTKPHINYVRANYPEEQGYNPGCHQVVKLDRAFIEIDLKKNQWTNVMDDQWEIYPIKPSLTKAELDDFQLGRGIPNCVLEARPLSRDVPQLLHGITLTGVKAPYNELTLRLYNNRPPRRDAFRLTVAIFALLVLCAVGYYAVSTLHNHHTFRNDEVQNLNDLIQAVKDIGDWQALCTNLGVNDGVIETLIHSTTTVDTKKADCLRAYFNDGEANWGDVVKAVAMHPIRNKRVAKCIAKTYDLDYNNIVKEEL